MGSVLTQVLVYLDDSMACNTYLGEQKYKIGRDISNTFYFFKLQMIEYTLQYYCIDLYTNEEKKNIEEMSKFSV